MNNMITHNSERYEISQRPAVKGPREGYSLRKGRNNLLFQILLASWSSGYVQSGTVTFTPKPDPVVFLEGKTGQLALEVDNQSSFTIDIKMTGSLIGNPHGDINDQPVAGPLAGVPKTLTPDTKATATVKFTVGP